MAVDRHVVFQMGFPGYNAIVPPTAKSVAKYLQQAGHVNYALGKPRNLTASRHESPVSGRSPLETGYYRTKSTCAANSVLVFGLATHQTASCSLWKSSQGGGGHTAWPCG